VKSANWLTHVEYDWESPVWRPWLENVADAAGVERFALLAMSQGASTCIEYAAHHPKRVSHLIVYGGYAVGWARRGGAYYECRKRVPMLVPFSKARSTRSSTPNTRETSAIS
jgi:pimeloyl-ACP methyl ester carboxylesterase